MTTKQIETPLLQQSRERINKTTLVEMKKRNFKNLFSGFAQKAKQTPEEKPTQAPESKASPENTEVGRDFDDEEEWGCDVPDEKETERPEMVDFPRDMPPLNDIDGHSFAASSVPTNGSSKALRKGHTFDQSDTSTSSFPSRADTDLFDPSDAKSILASEGSTSFGRQLGQTSLADDTVSIADSSFTTRASTSMFFQPQTFDLTGASLLGMTRDEGESNDIHGTKSTISSDYSYSYAHADVAHGFSSGVHSFFRSVFNPKIAEGDEEEEEEE